MANPQVKVKKGNSVTISPEVINVHNSNADWHRLVAAHLDVPGTVKSVLPKTCIIQFPKTTLCIPKSLLIKL